jgi:MoxR-like ATPase
VILLDEISNADAGELAPLNGLLEPNAAVSFGGRVWRRAPGVLIFAADNTFGNGDETGRHTGTRTQNVALIDRFSRIIPFTFLPAKQEIQAIMSRAGCSNDLAQHVHAAIDLARSKVAKAEIVDAPSIRSAIAFCRAVQVLTPKDAWETTVVARQPSESAATLRGIYEVCIDEKHIAKCL